MRSLFPASDSEARVVDRQLDMLRAHTKLIPYAVPAAAVAGAVAVSRWVDKPLLIVWLVALAIVAVAHEAVSRHFERRPRTTVADVRRRAIAMTIACTVYLAIWTSFGIWAWAPDVVVSHYLVCFVLGCTIAAACTMGAVHTASVIGVAAPASILMIAQPALADTLDPMTGICVVFVLLMAAFARSTHLMTERALRLENDRAELIDSLRSARDESETARRRAEAANRAKSEFLANMSHELRTPLNAIIGFSDIITSRSVGPASDKYVEYAGFINESGNHLLALISGVLELAKIEAGRKMLTDESVNVSKAIEETVEELRPVARDREVTIDVSPAPALPALRADAHAVHEILFHLLSNAVKFTQPNGYVKIGAQMTAHDELVLVVADTGLGIDPEVQAQVFDRFGRGQHDIARANAGAGLGLPIVKGLAELHGGRVNLISAPGEGTRVSVFFPADRIGAVAARRAAS